MTNLYLDRLPEQDREFRKEAAFAARLSEQAENWPQELTSELFKQLPFLSDYDVNVNLDRVEPQRGFAFGFADVATRTERPEVEHDESGIPHIRIPLVVHERAVKPFTVFLDGELVLPLTENRVRELLFNPATFDLSTSEPRDPSLVESMMPPQRSGMGGGEIKTASAKDENRKKWGRRLAVAGTVAATAVGAKMLHSAHRAGAQANKSREMLKKTMSTPTASTKFPEHAQAEAARIKAMKEDPKWGAVEDAANKFKETEKRASLLMAIAPTISEKDAAAFIEKVASDATIRAGFARSGISERLVEVFDKTKRASATDRLSALAESIAPTVMTLQKLPGGDFLVKSANVNAFQGGEPAQGQVVPEEEVAQAVGPENAQAMKPGQTATVVSDPVEAAPPEESRVKMIEEFGQFKVQDGMGNSLMGHVFPKTLAWDGSFTPQPIALFTNGSAYAVHDTIAGEMVGKGTNLPADAPRGDGVFYSVEGGEAICTAPITVGSSMSGPDGSPTLMGTDIFGNQLQVSLVDGLKSPQRISDVEYAIPSTWKFMRLNNQTQLVTDPVQVVKQASARSEGSSATLFYNGSYHLTGGCGLEKIAYELKTDLDPVSAEFMLGVLGVDGVMAKQKVAEARRKGSIKLAGLKTITTLGERYAQAEKTASALVSKIPNLRRDLIKEAASVGEVSTVDNILALNFVNPENLATFVAYVPDLEMCAEKLAEMLLSSYVGMQELPEGAIERSMRNMEEVTQALKNIAHSMHGSEEAGQ